ncbi:MAG TPA: tetratricopeptide repeat protein [Candidatus Hydrogenedentes bacterium]|nr:tetratricopeptide repeat protein [Candidatus Hydrogenedentota bacterium]
MREHTEKSQQFIGVSFPYATVFFSSFCIMTVELVAGRIIARHVGMSLYTWTAIIGVIMAGISVGNYLGGKIADRWRARHSLSVLFFAAAAGCAAILPLNTLVGALSLLMTMSWPTRIFLHVFLVFILSATILGMIHPVVAKMALDYKQAAGRTVGGVFAWSVAGSLAGTFATGYYLVMVFGATAIVVVSALGLAALGIVYAVAALVSDEKRPLLIQEAEASVRSLYHTAAVWLPGATTVFVSNLAFMTFELAAIRIVAQEFGGSLYAWTTVIGVVLGGISLGNYFGGIIADRWRSTIAIMTVFSLSALTVLVSPMLGAFMRSWQHEFFFFARMSWPMQIFCHVMMLCFVPCIFIGMVSPIITRRLLEQGRAPGAAVGAIYAWGSVGAIFGTFLTGYFLIQWMGALPVIVATALLLTAVAVAYAPRNPIACMLLLLACFSLFASMASSGILGRAGEKLRLRSSDRPLVVYEDESQYSRITIREDAQDPMLREMLLDQLVHSRIDLRDPTRLLYEYEWVYSAVMEKQHAHSEPVRAFVIGGGGYAYPNYLAHARPGSDIIVAEIDPAVTEAAHNALGLPRDTPITIYDMDARNVAVDLTRAMTADPNFEKFDYIFGDSINDYTVPYHLTTLEFKRMADALLKENGVYMLNMIDMLDSGAFLAAIINTCREVFPSVSVFNTGRLPFVRDTFIVVCTKRHIALQDVPMLLQRQYKEYKGRLLSDEEIDRLIEKHNGITLTDDFAPVENLIAPVVRTRAGDSGELHLQFARRYAEQNDVERALRHCQAAIKVHSRWPEAYEFQAELLFRQGDVDGALNALINATDGHAAPGAAWYNVAKAALDAGRRDLALEAWGKCVVAQPDHVAGWYNLGVLYGTANDLQNAVNAWKMALKYRPDHEDSLHNLAAAYVMLGSANEAAEVLNTMREYGIAVDPGLVDAIKNIREQTAPRP